MKADCHMHMVLDGIDWKTSIARHKDSPHIPTIRHALSLYREQGYTYLREAILERIRDPNQSVTKELYPTVAALCCATAIQVERSIRSAVAAAWTRRDEQIWRLYFQPEPDGILMRPTNAAFISRLADSVALTMGTSEEKY